MWENSVQDTQSWNSVVYVLKKSLELSWVCTNPWKRGLAFIITIILMGSLLINRKLKGMYLGEKAWDSCKDVTPQWKPFVINSLRRHSQWKQLHRWNTEGSVICAVYTDSVLHTCSVLLTDKDTKPEWSSNFIKVKYLIESGGGVFGILVPKMVNLSDIKHPDFSGIEGFLGKRMVGSS